MGKIKINFLEINFVGKKLPEVALYTRTVFTRKWCWKNLSFQYVVQNDMLNNFHRWSNSEIVTVRAPEFFEVQRPNST